MLEPTRLIDFLNEAPSYQIHFEGMENPDADWLIVYQKNNDPSIYDSVNFEVALKMLGGESEDVNTMQLGFLNLLCVRENSEKMKIAKEILTILDSEWPYLDDDLYSEREDELAQFLWQQAYNYKERIDYIRKHRSEFEFANLSDLISQVRGVYFGGNSFELVTE